MLFIPQSSDSGSQGYRSDPTYEGARTDILLKFKTNTSKVVQIQAAYRGFRSRRRRHDWILRVMESGPKWIERREDRFHDWSSNIAQVKLGARYTHWRLAGSIFFAVSAICTVVAMSVKCKTVEANLDRMGAVDSADECPAMWALTWASAMCFVMGCICNLMMKDMRRQQRVIVVVYAVLWMAAVVVFCMASGFIYDLIESGRSSVPGHKLRWGWKPATFFSITVISTIGYGDYSPTTWEAKVWTVVIALFGIPLFGLCLDRTGKAIKVASNCTIHFFAQFVGRIRQQSAVECIFVLIVTILMLTTGAQAFGEQFGLEDYWDGLYFMFISASTIGFGTYHPPVTEDMYLIFTLTIIFTMSCLAALFNYLSDSYQSGSFANCNPFSTNAEQEDQGNTLISWPLQNISIQTAPDSLVKYYTQYRTDFYREARITPKQHKAAAMQVWALKARGLNEGLEEQLPSKSQTTNDTGAGLTWCDDDGSMGLDALVPMDELDELQHGPATCFSQPVQDLTGRLC